MKNHFPSLLILLFLAGCNQNAKSVCEVRVPSQTINLMAGTKSYESINQVLNAASNLGPYQIVEGRIDTFDCKRQPSTRLKYQYEINGFNGSVEFVFYFGALAETRFHPDDPQSFFKSELNEFPKHRGQEKKVGNKIYWTEGRNGIADTIGIADDRLIEQFNRWARNYN